MLDYIQSNILFANVFYCFLIAISVILIPWEKRPHFHPCPLHFFRWLNEDSVCEGAYHGGGLKNVNSLCLCLLPQHLTLRCTSLSFLQVIPILQMQLKGSLLSMNCFFTIEWKERSLSPLNFYRPTESHSAFLAGVLLITLPVSFLGIINFFSERKREKHWFVVPLIYAVLVLTCALAEIEPRNLGVSDNTLSTPSGPEDCTLLCVSRAWPIIDLLWISSIWFVCKINTYDSQL